MYGSPGFAVITPPAPGQAQVPSVGFQQQKSVFRFGETTIWGTQRYVAGAPLANNQVGRIFATAIGQTGSGFALPVTIGETNIKVGGYVPDGQAFDVFGITLLIYFGNNADAAANVPVDTDALIGAVLNVLHNAALSWDFSQSTVDVGPCHLIGAGGGLFGALSTADTATPAQIGHMNNGAGTMWLYRHYPVALPGNVTFAMLPRFGSRAAANAANNDIYLKCGLLGYYKNVVETG